MEKAKKVVKRGRPFNTNSNTEDGSKRARGGDGADDSWEDFIPIAAAIQYRKEMEEEEVEIGEDDIDAAKMHVIDNSLANSHTSFSAKYGTAPLKLRHSFSEMLLTCGQPKLGAIIKRCATNVVEMPWRNNDNQLHDGIYLMRHMETFFGSNEKEWSCGLTAKGTKSLETLRMKVNSTLILSEHNAWAKVIQNLATSHWKGKKIKGSFKNWIQNYGL